MLETEGTSRTFRAALVRVGAIDLVLFTITLLSWSWFGLIDLRIALPLTALRVAAWVIHLRVCLRPIQAFDRDLTALDDEHLLALDTSLQVDLRRFVRGYGLGLLVAFGGSAALSALGVVPDFVIARAELTALALLTGAVVIAAPEIPRGALEMLVYPLQSQLTAILEARGLSARRMRSSALRVPIQSTALFIAGLTLGLGGLAHYMEVRGLRSATEAHQQLVVERAATSLAATGTLGTDAARLVDEVEVPSVLATQVAAKIAAGEPLPASFAAHEPQRDLIVAAAPTNDGRWILAETRTDEHLAIFIIVLTAIVIGAVPLMIAAMYFNMRRIAQPLAAITALAERFATEGELRSLERLHPGCHDELGQLATSFNAMLDNLEQLTDAAEAIGAGQLDVELEAPGQLHDAFRAMLDHLANSVTRLRATAIDVASAAGEIEALTHTQGDAINEQAAAVQQATSTVSTLATSAAQIADAAHEVLVDAEQAAATTSATSDQIRLLREQTTTIEALLDQIREIADRSDLLALNGSLEATRAGEAGRGFALVASEMRRLAERVTAVVDDVRVGVTAIETASASAVEVTEDSRRIAGQTAEAARMISAVTAEQSSSTEQVADGMVQLADAVINATQAVAQTRAAASGLRDVAAELEQLTRGFQLPTQ